MYQTIILIETREWLLFIKYPSGTLLRILITASLECLDAKFKICLFHSVLKNERAAQGMISDHIINSIRESSIEKLLIIALSVVFLIAGMDVKLFVKSIGQRLNSNLSILFTGAKRQRKGLINNVQGNTFASALSRNASVYAILTTRIFPEPRLSAISWRFMWGLNGPEVGKILVFYRW